MPPAVARTLGRPLRLAPLAGQCRPVNDTVMGGASACAADADANGGALRFEGSVSEAGGGGFASIALPELPALPAEDGSAEPDALVLMCAGDGNAYKLSVRTQRGFGAPSYQHDFEAPAGEEVRRTTPPAGTRARWCGHTLTRAPVCACARMRLLARRCRWYCRSLHSLVLSAGAWFLTRRHCEHAMPWGCRSCAPSSATHMAAVSACLSGRAPSS